MKSDVISKYHGEQGAQGAHGAGVGQQGGKPTAMRDSQQVPQGLPVVKVSCAPSMLGLGPYSAVVRRGEAGIGLNVSLVGKFENDVVSPVVGDRSIMAGEPYNPS